MSSNPNAPRQSQAGEPSAGDPMREPLRPLDFWTDIFRWPLDPAGYVFLGRAIHDVGMAMHGTNWTGDEPVVFCGDMYSPLEDTNREKLQRLSVAKREIVKQCEAGTVGAAYLSDALDLERIPPKLWRGDAWKEYFQLCQLLPSRRPFIRNPIFLLGPDLRKLLTSLAPPLQCGGTPAEHRADTPSPNPSTKTLTRPGRPRTEGLSADQRAAISAELNTAKLEGDEIKWAAAKTIPGANARTVQGWRNRNDYRLAVRDGLKPKNERN